MEKNNTFLKSFFTYFAIMIIAAAIIWFLGLVARILWAFIGLITVAAVSAAVLALFKPLGKAKENREEQAPMPPAIEDSPGALALENLVRINLHARESGMEDGLLSELELLIDKLFDVLPRLSEQNRGSELSFVVNKIAGDYLSRIISSYLGLAPSSRTAQTEELMRILKGLNEEINDITKIVEEQATGEFKTHAKFISTKFFGETLEA